MARIDSQKNTALLKAEGESAKKYPSSGGKIVQAIFKELTVEESKGEAVTHEEAAKIILDNLIPKR